ncbi:MAG: DegT/DnrJ/EryC1/StrS family aminotransferase [FCB group bacterium]|jgi:dTDP-4-amino-4,6-dideoxygalactose transaminase|nr:DegT/DnrJ/EryC1/StrS family aminotransferase [FCB group bacterium]
MEKLAIHGGDKVRPEPIQSAGPRFDEQELKELKEALDQQTLFYWYGTKVKEFRRQFAALYGVKYCHMVTSGTAALHVATCTLGIGPGDEVITSPITDQGTIVAILAQGGVPVFADVDPHTYNITAESIAKVITRKTRAFIVVHLAGNPAHMGPILELAESHEIKVIEDCAQSYLAWYKGRPVGTMGDMGCFSLNDFKHISVGDGGMVITNDDALSARAALALDKGYHRDGSGRRPGFLAMNYRPSELHGAVALAQLRKLPRIVAQRNMLGDRLTEKLAGIPGLHPHKVLEHCKSSYWFYMGRMEPEMLGVSRDDFVAAVAAEGIPITPGYIGRMVYEYPLLTEHHAYEHGDFPWDGTYGRKLEYGPDMCPVAEEVEATAWRLPITEFMCEQDIDDIATALRKVVLHYADSRVTA